MDWQPETTVETSQEEWTQYLYIIRHGDRWDIENPDWGTMTSRPVDTPLSQLGHNQARETGLFLNQLFKEDDIESNDIVWLSSPYLRCLQTSDEALNALTIPNANAIKILPEYAVSEWGGDLAQLPTLRERRHYFPRLDESYESMFKPPRRRENSRAFGERCEQVASKIGGFFPLHHHSNKALVIVTHAAACVGIAEAVAPSGTSWADISPAAPCGVYRLSRTLTKDQEQKPRIIDMRDKLTADGRPNLNGYIGHLSTACGSTKAWHPQKRK